MGKKIFFIFVSVVIIIFSCNKNAVGQDLKLFPADENYTLTLAFHKADTILVVIPDSYAITDGDKKDIEEYVFWERWQKRPYYTYKKESELVENDVKKHIQLYGPFCDFRKLDLLNIPIKQINNGFALDGKNFDFPYDAFFYINDDGTRLYTCRNSNQTLNLYKTLGVGGYQLYIFCGKEVMITGQYSDKNKTKAINLLDDERSKYFRAIYTKYFDFEIARTHNYDSIKNNVALKTDEYIDSLCDFLGVDNCNIERMKTYVYRNNSDLNLFIGAPKWMVTYGKSLGDINHVCNFGFPLFMHEAAHSIIALKIGMNPSSFFVEGFAQYTGHFFSKSSYNDELEITKANLSLLTPELVREKSVSVFYSNPHYYPIAAVFTHFLISKIGLDEFKKAYSENKIEEVLIIKTGSNFNQLISEFKANNALKK